MDGAGTESRPLVTLYNLKFFVSILAYFPYFEKIKVGL
jgi:hypothetical protein